MRLIAFGQGSGSLGGHRSQREGHALRVRSDAEQQVPEAEPLRPRQHLPGDQERRGEEPVPVQEVPFDNCGRIRRRRDPGRYLPGDSEHLTDLGLDEVLVPDQAGERSSRQHDAPDYVRQAAGDVIQYIYLLFAQGSERTPCYLGKQDDGNPLGGGSETRTGNQAHVDSPGHHQEADEESTENRPPGEAVGELHGSGQQVAVP